MTEKPRDGWSADPETQRRDQLIAQEQGTTPAQRLAAVETLLYELGIVDRVRREHASIDEDGATSGG